MLKFKRTARRSYYILKIKVTKLDLNLERRKAGYSAHIAQSLNPAGVRWSGRHSVDALTVRGTRTPAKLYTHGLAVIVLNF